MNINYIEYSIATRSLDIFFAGCKNRCKDCYNPDLMNFDNGTSYISWIPKIDHYLKEYKSLINKVLLVGGSPNHQNIKEMEAFLVWLEYRCNKDRVKIYAFCGEEIEDVIEPIKIHCHRIKTGSYIPELKVENNIQDNIKLATSNQRILYKDKDY